MLYVVKMGWKEMADTSRIDEVLSHALKEVSHITIDSLTAFMDLCSRTKEHMGGSENPLCTPFGKRRCQLWVCPGHFLFIPTRDVSGRIRGRRSR